MAKQPEDTLLTTYAKLTLSNWPIIADLIRKYSHVPKAMSPDEPVDTQEDALELQQINDAISGPFYGFLQNKIAAYATLGNVRMALTVENDDTFKDNLSNDNKAFNFDKTQLAKITEEDINNIKASLDQLTTQQDEQWQTHYQQWAAELCDKINQNGIELSVMELDEIQRLEPISEIDKRYTELNLEKPKLKGLATTFMNYLILRCYLLIHSSLSRQHKTHDAATINQYLKGLKKDFDGIHKSEELLLNTQIAETNDVIRKINFAALKNN